jgi:hypothetical protein
VRAKKAEEEEKEADNSTEVLMNVKTVRAFCREEVSSFPSLPFSYHSFFPPPDIDY